VVLADDMGLGKTVQALAAAELLRRRKGIERVLVVAPASVKVPVEDRNREVLGSLRASRRRAARPAATVVCLTRVLHLTSYELVIKDVSYIHELKPDLIILDEAQRIRNWITATARTIKQLKSRYAFVLTGTPLENKLENSSRWWSLSTGAAWVPPSVPAGTPHGKTKRDTSSAIAAWIAFTRNWSRSCSGAREKRFSRNFPNAPTRFSASP